MNVTKAWAAQLDDYAIDLAWSPDGRVLAVASAAGPITFFDGANGRKRHELPGHANGTNAIAWMLPVGRVVPHTPLAPDDAAVPREQENPLPWLATGGQDGCVRWWDADAGIQVADAPLAAGAWIEQLAWRPMAANLKSQVPVPVPAMLAAAAGRKLLLLRPDGSVVQTWADAPKTLSALAWHPQGGCVAVAWFGGVCLWDADDFRVQRQYAYGSAIQALTWSPDGRWLVAGAQDNAVHLWLPEEDQEFHMSGYETKVRELSFSHDSRWLATGGARDACVWDCSGAGPEGREPLALPHTGRVCAVTYQHTRGLLATAAADHEVALWDPPRPQPLVASIKLTAPASKLAWSPDDRQLAIGSQQGGVLVLQVGT